MYRYKPKQNRNTKVCSCIHIPFLASSPQMPCPILSNYLSCKPHPGLNIYKLESTFAGIINSKNSISLLEIFINILQWTLLILTLIALTVVLTKYQKSKKLLIALDGFNVNLLNYDNHNPKNEFIVSLA